MKIDHLVNTSLDECRSSIIHASTEQLRAALKWANGRPGHASRVKLLSAAIKRREITAETEAALPAAPKGLPSDLELLKKAHPHDVPRIAAAAGMRDLEQAAVWAIRTLPGSSDRRRAIESEIAKRKGGRQ